MVYVGVNIDEKLNFAIEQIAKDNNTTKSEIIREALRLFANGMLEDVLLEVEKRLDNIEKKLEKELNRYNSLLAKNTLYSIAGRQHLVYYNIFALILCAGGQV